MKERTFKERLRDHREFNKKFREGFESDEEFREFQKRHKLMHRRANEIFFLHKYLHILKYFTLIITLVIILFIFKIIGFRTVSVIVTLVLIINEGSIIYMMSRLKKRLIAPMGKLQKGVKKISEGDYSIRLNEDSNNEIGILTREFNKMAEKLQEGERIKKEYENNRKELITSISHDLKTPITSINGYVEGLMEGVVPEEKVNDYLKIIRSNGLYMNKLIDDLFLFSKLDMQKLEFAFNKTNIKDYLYDITEEFSFTLEEKGIKFFYEDEITEEVYVNIDGKRLHRAIRNLVDNAIKYGVIEEELRIKIKLYKERNNIFIKVIDNGPGIEADKINNIFDRFYRIDKERTKDLSSTGLGLAIAKEIIEAHGGKISVKSEIDMGSTFIIKLPIFKEEEDNSESKENFNN
ncbi:MAG: sensor histidine kinase [Sarcina sp.]